MPILTKELLQDIGIEMGSSEYESLSQHFETVLEERIFTEIVEELSDEQAHELAQLKNSSDADIASWLKTNVPTDLLREIVDDELAILMGELAENSTTLET